MMSDRFETIIRYNLGDAKNKEMDYISLIKSLEAFYKLITISDKKISGESGRIKLNIRVKQDQECFELILSILTNPAITSGIALIIAPIDLARLIGIAKYEHIVHEGKSFLGLLSIMYGLSSLNVAGSLVKIENNNTINNITNITNNYYIPEKVIELLEDKKIHDNAHNFLKPLKDGKSDSMEFRDLENGEQSLIFRSKDYLNYKRKDFTKNLSIEKSTEILGIKKVVYKGDDKWTLLLDNKEIEVLIKDKKWLDEFQGNQFEVLPNGKLKVILETTNFLGYKGNILKKPEYAITEVYKVIPPMTQEVLFKK